MASRALSGVTRLIATSALRIGKLRPDPMSSKSWTWRALSWAAIHQAH